ncbi:MAG: GNAT family N-acetyltransferase [Flavobacteriales bacterium]
MRKPVTLSFDPFPEIVTERLKLCKLTNEFVEPFFRLRSENDVMRYIERPRAQNLDDVHQFIANTEILHASEEGFTWAICTKAERTFIGIIGFYRLDKDIFRGELGYSMLPEFWGQGIMSEAIQAALDFGFNQIGFNSIEADINPDNAASAKILLRNGFLKEGYIRENVYWNGEFLDTEMYSMLHSDWKKLHP